MKNWQNNNSVLNFKNIKRYFLEHNWCKYVLVSFIGLVFITSIIFNIIYWYYKSCNQQRINCNIEIKYKVKNNEVVTTKSYYLLQNGFLTWEKFLSQDSSEFKLENQKLVGVLINDGTWLNNTKDAYWNFKTSSFSNLITPEAKFTINRVYTSNIGIF